MTEVMLDPLPKLFSGVVKVLILLIGTDIEWNALLFVSML